MAGIAGREPRAEGFAAERGHHQIEQAAPCSAPDGSIEPSTVARHSRTYQLRVEMPHDHEITVRFSPAEIGRLAAAAEVIGGSRSLLLAGAATAAADADLADPGVARARVGPVRRPPAEAKRASIVEALFTQDDKHRILTAAALTGRNSAWYVADAGLRGAAHILRTAASGADSVLSPDAAIPDMQIPDSANPANALANDTDAEQDAAVFSRLTSFAGTGTDSRRELVQTVEQLSFQLRKVGTNLNQIAHAVNATGTAEHADAVLDRIDNAARAVHDVLVGLVARAGACSACGHRERPGMSAREEMGRAA